MRFGGLCDAESVHDTRIITNTIYRRFIVLHTIFQPISKLYGYPIADFIVYHYLIKIKEFMTV
ncbi:hypothetical protein CBFG_01613 [Clostridiales bacterium 1_7_47FAA]|nr:hypothetical protein CBFG_01613 [Clostridiales bacterium 1_7_47FAA]